MNAYGSLGSLRLTLQSSARIRMPLRCSSTGSRLVSSVSTARSRARLAAPRSVPKRTPKMHTTSQLQTCRFLSVSVNDTRSLTAKSARPRSRRANPRRAFSRLLSSRLPLLPILA